MSNRHRGFVFDLNPPLLLAGWNLETGKREVASMRQALLESEQSLKALELSRRGLLEQGPLVHGSRLDLRLRDLQLKSLAQMERRLIEARRAEQERRSEWEAAVERCVRLQQKVDGLNDIRAEQLAAFERHQVRQNARRSDDDWLGRRRAAAMQGRHHDECGELVTVPHRGTSGFESSSHDSMGSPSGHSADVWRKEMERQQQLSWFLPALPSPAGLFWVAASPLNEGDRSYVEAQERVAGGGQMVAHGASPPAIHDASGSDISASAVHGEVHAQRAVPDASAFPALASAALGKEIFGAIQSLIGQASLVEAAVPPASVQVIEPRAVSITQATGHTPPNGSFFEPSPENVEPAKVASAAPIGSREHAPPVRVHCDWQDGQLTVWIGHDRGHAESAALLVQTIERWLHNQRLPGAGFIVNGSPLGKESPELFAAADDSIDNSPTWPPYQVVHSAQTMRENA